MTFNMPNDVRGWLQEKEGVALYMLSAGKTVLEIGSYCGRSTICIAQSAERVVAVDWQQGGWGVVNNDSAEFRANLERYCVSGKIEVHEVEIQKYGPTIPNTTYDMVFVDGNHSEPFVKYDAELALRVTKPGGIIAFHDWPEVVMYVGAMMGEPVGMVETLAWFNT